VTAIWIGLLLAAGATVFMVVTSWRHRIEMAELGSVSEQWLAEQRANDRYHSER
jgi:hypothetical protein